MNKEQEEFIKAYSWFKEHDWQRLLEHWKDNKKLFNFYNGCYKKWKSAELSRKVTK